MKNIFARSLFASALGLFVLTSLTRAADAPPPPAGEDQPPPPEGGPRGRRGGRMMVERLKEKLNLTAAQVEQIKAIFADQMQQFKALHEDTSIADDDKRAKAHSLREAGRQKIRAVLTVDQQTIFDTLPRPGRDGGPPPPPPPAN